MEETDFSEQLNLLFETVTPGTALTVPQQLEFDDLLLTHHQAACRAEKGCRKLRMGKNYGHLPLHATEIYNYSG
jgi:hypothetical protein